MKTKKLFGLVAALACAVGLVFAIAPAFADGATDTWDGSVAAGYAGGDGTADNPYQIATGAQLAYLAQEVNAGTSYSGKYFVQTANLDLTGSEWTAIGKSKTVVFGGVYDGSNKTISYKISKVFRDNAELVGGTLFGYVYGTGAVNAIDSVHAKISNLTVNASLGFDSKYSFVKKDMFAGVLIASQNAEISNITTGATIWDINNVGERLYAGGIAVYEYGGSVYDSCTNNISVDVENNFLSTGSKWDQYFTFGGILGRAELRAGQFSVVQNCMNTGSLVQANPYDMSAPAGTEGYSQRVIYGGIIGQLNYAYEYYQVLVLDCSSTGTCRAGGNCYWDGSQWFNADGSNQGSRGYFVGERWTSAGAAGYSKYGVAGTTDWVGDYANTICWGQKYYVTEDNFLATALTESALASAYPCNGATYHNAAGVNFTYNAPGGSQTVINDNSQTTHLEAISACASLVGTYGGKYATSPVVIFGHVAKIVAQIGDAKYTSLAEAIAAVEDGQTITVLENLADQTCNLTKAGVGYTLDLNGKTLGMKPTGYVLNVPAGKTVTIKNGTIDVDGSNMPTYGSSCEYLIGYGGTGTILNVENASLSVKNIDSATQGAYFVFNGEGGKLNLTNNAKLSLVDVPTCFYNVNNGDFEYVTAKDSELTFKGITDTIFHVANVSLEGSKLTVETEAAKVAGFAYSSLTAKDSSVSIKGAEYPIYGNSSSGYFTFEVGKYSFEGSSSLSISESDYNVSVDKLTIPAGVTVTIDEDVVIDKTASVAAGNYLGKFAAKTGSSPSISITGGYYRDDVSSLCATGYICIPDTTVQGCNYKVVKSGTITFDANGGKLGDVSMSKYVYGEGQLCEALPAVNRDGYMYYGWNTEKDGSGIYVAEGAPLVVANDFTLYAQWVKQQASETDGNKTYVAAASTDSSVKVNEASAKAEIANVKAIEASIQAGTADEAIGKEAAAAIKAATADTTKSYEYLISIDANVEEGAPEDDMKLIEDKAEEEELNVSKVYDLSVWLTVVNKTDNVIVSDGIYVQKVDNKLVFTLDAGTTLAGKVVKVVQVHNGEAKEIEPTDIDTVNNTVTIEVSEFSTFAVLASDEIVIPVPDTGDSAPLGGIALFALLAVAGLAIARKRLA